MMRGRFTNIYYDVVATQVRVPVGNHLKNITLNKFMFTLEILVL